MASFTRSSPYVVLYFAVMPCLAAVEDSQLPDETLPIVLTPTRLRQSLADVPASVTIITSEMLKTYGIASVPDALRLVPGMLINQVTGSDFRIGYHGGNVLTPRRMNVLIDGRSAYRTGFARVDWDQLPVAIEDIDRIEVTRGPNSVTYGANSMTAIVNIITKHARDTEGAFIQLRGGAQDTASVTARYGGTIGQSTSYRMTFDHYQDSGFDFASSLRLGRDDIEKNMLNFRSISEFGEKQSLDIEAGILKVEKEVEFADRFQKSFPDIKSRDYYLNARWRKSFSDSHELQIQTYATHHTLGQAWGSCPPTATLLPEMFAMWRANPRYAQAILAGQIPSGGSASDNALAAAALGSIARLGLTRARAPTCVEIDQDFEETRYDLEIQDTYVFSPTLRIVGGLGARSDQSDSLTFLNGKVRNSGWRVFANVEYKPSTLFTINAGGFFEDDELTERAFSPRLAVNAHVTASHTLRFVISQAVRTPDIFEQRADWRFRTSNMDPPLNGSTTGAYFQSEISPGHLKNEKILSWEIGYLGNFPSTGLRLDAKVFDDELKDLISEKLQISDFRPTNQNSARLRGAELQITYQPNRRWNAHFAYAYLDNDTSNFFERSIYARHSGSLGVAYTTANQLSFALVLLSNGPNHEGQTYFAREDLTISKTVRLGAASQLHWSLTLRHLENRSSTFLVDVGQVRESSFDDALQYFFTLGASF